MLVTDRKILKYNIKEIHFSDQPYDMEGCDMLKFHYCTKKVDVKGFTCKKELTSFIDLTQDIETIWNNMGNKSTRSKIKRARRENITIHINKYHEEFLEIFKSFSQKKGIKSFFDSFGVGSISIEYMKKYGILFMYEHDNEILGGNLYLEDDSHFKALLSASKRLEVDKTKSRIIGFANRLTDWEAIIYAKEKGLKVFDWCGLWPEEEAEKDSAKKGINDFKLGFGGTIEPVYTYEKIYSKSLKLAYQLYNLKNQRLRGGGQN